MSERSVAETLVEDEDKTVECSVADFLIFFDELLEDERNELVDEERVGETLVESGVEVVDCEGGSEGLVLEDDWEVDVGTVEDSLGKLLHNGRREASEDRVPDLEDDEEVARVSLFVGVLHDSRDEGLVFVRVEKPGVVVEESEEKRVDAVTDGLAVRTGDPEAAVEELGELGIAEGSGVFVGCGREEVGSVEKLETLRGSVDEREFLAALEEESEEELLLEEGETDGLDLSDDLADETETLGGVIVGSLSAYGGRESLKERDEVCRLE